MDREEMKTFGKKAAKAALIGAVGPVGMSVYENRGKITAKGKEIVSSAHKSYKKLDEKYQSYMGQARGEFKKTGEGLKKAGIAAADSLDRVARAHTPAGVIDSSVGLIKDKLAERKSNKMRAEVNEKAAESLGNRGRYNTKHIIPLRSGGSDSAANLRILPKILKK